VALITGGDRGIGAACAAALADQGHMVAVTDRHGGAADRRVLAIDCDVSDRTALADLVAHTESELGPIGILVSNAGAAAGASPATSLNWDAIEQSIGLNLVAPMVLTRLVLRSMLSSHWGRLVYVSSTAADTGRALASTYSAGKSGLVGFARSVARETAARGVTSNVVCPGLIETRLGDRIRERAREAAVSAIPMQRAGTATEVASLVAFLASEDSSYITGAVVPVDGGVGMGR